MSHSVFLHTEDDEAIQSPESSYKVFTQPSGHPDAVHDNCQPREYNM